MTDLRIRDEHGFILIAEEPVDNSKAVFLLVHHESDDPTEGAGSPVELTREQAEQLRDWLSARLGS